MESEPQQGPLPILIFETTARNQTQIMPNGAEKRKRTVVCTKLPKAKGNPPKNPQQTLRLLAPMTTGFRNQVAGHRNSRKRFCINSCRVRATRRKMRVRAALGFFEGSTGRTVNYFATLAIGTCRLTADRTAASDEAEPLTGDRVGEYLQQLLRQRASQRIPTQGADHLKWGVFATRRHGASTNNDWGLDMGLAPVCSIFS